MKIIRDPKKVSLLVEQSRWEIWNLLKDDGRMTAEAIAEKVQKNVSTVYRHLKKLTEAGFIQEFDVQKGNQKYFVKEYSADLTDAFFLLSEEAESLIASQQETSLLDARIPVLLDHFSYLGLAPSTKEEEKRAKVLISKLSIGLSTFLGKLVGDRSEVPKEYNHQFEVMCRILAMFLTQINTEYGHQVEELRKILLKR
ncbi:MAG: winged helix-turn-helix transcriptional regulator [Candidatus Hodarchaeota archaeon]